MVHAFSLANVGSCRRPHHKSKIVNGSEESLTINKPKPRSGPHLAFAIFVVTGSILSIAAAVVERRSVNDALEAWDVRAGTSIGLEARMGVLAHCTSCGPLLSLALFFPSSHLLVPIPLSS